MTNGSTTEVKHIAEIVKVLNSGIDFYHEAQEAVDNPVLATVFESMVNARRRAVQRLQPYAVLEEGEVEDGSSFSVEVRKLYTKIMAAVKSDTEQTYISQLEEIEDKTLNEVKTALEKDQPVACRAALSDILADIQECHDKMLTLQKSRE
ncbi:PA2169 family four-helix-bundle protein [Exilibacterium tricleocarpae]|uniref:PA2169 family four-helix-bundle protein n=2 Tax=Exilibacterium tricleocarpae TaxID=2591008 RepID=A0A545SXQ5_9GAMM|nr:PA2169 family four-helix-bundle protein [Exilibacterium tricleocarpae]